MNIYSTGQVASLTRMSQQTVIRVCNIGLLEHFRVPGSRFRRVTRECLIAFMRVHNLPMDRAKIRIVMVGENPQLVLDLKRSFPASLAYEVTECNDGFHAGFLIGDGTVAFTLVVLDCLTVSRGVLQNLSLWLRSEQYKKARSVRVIALNTPVGDDLFSLVEIALVPDHNNPVERIMRYFNVYSRNVQYA